MALVLLDAPVWIYKTGSLIWNRLQLETALDRPIQSRFKAKYIPSMLIFSWIVNQFYKLPIIPLLTFLKETNKMRVKQKSCMALEILKLKLKNILTFGKKFHHHQPYLLKKNIINFEQF